jgi:hypothetical protein
MYVEEFGRLQAVLLVMLRNAVITSFNPFEEWNVFNGPNLLKSGKQVRRSWANLYFGGGESIILS